MPTETTLLVDHLDTPLGRLAIIVGDGRLCSVGWTDGHPRMERTLGAATTLAPASNPGGLTAALRAYFGGDVSAIDGLPVDPRGTEFQRVVWRALRDIPCGETISYGTLARRIGNANAVRAVGLANGANPVAVIVPCHRVIGSQGTLTGYGAGLARKRWLLAHEQAQAPARSFSSRDRSACNRR